MYSRGFLNITNQDELSIWLFQLILRLIENLIFFEKAVEFQRNYFLDSRINILNFKLPGIVLNANNKVNVKLGESF